MKSASILFRLKSPANGRECWRRPFAKTSRPNGAPSLTIAWSTPVPGSRVSWSVCKNPGAPATR